MNENELILLESIRCELIRLESIKSDGEFYWQNHFGLFRFREREVILPLLFAQISLSRKCFFLPSPAGPKCSFLRTEPGGVYGIENGSVIQTT